jgi:hypothetical protein
VSSLQFSLIPITVLAAFSMGFEHHFSSAVLYNTKLK